MLGGYLKSPSLSVSFVGDCWRYELSKAKRQITRSQPGIVLSYQLSKSTWIQCICSATHQALWCLPAMECDPARLLAQGPVNTGSLDKILMCSGFQADRQLPVHGSAVMVSSTYLPSSSTTFIPSSNG